MKTCPKCSQPRVVTDFHWKNKSKGIRRSDMCRFCWKGYHQAHYQQNKADYHARARQSKADTRAERNRLKDVPCVDCKVKYPPWVMQFDHIRDKKRVVAKIDTLPALAEEVQNCEVVCANCHADRTYQRRLAGIA